MRRAGPALVLLILGAASLAVAQGDPTAHREAPVPELVVHGLAFRNIGPAVMGGRVSDLAVFEGNPELFYVGTATGGLWKTEDGGTTWQILFDEEAVVSIGAVAVSQQDPDRIWIGTGEPDNRQSSSWGGGVYRSVDGGWSWMHLGLEDTKHVARIVLDPRDPNVASVAAMGHLWGPNEERGVFRTRDGGATWERVLYVDEHTGVTDLVLDPSRPDVLYAAAYQRRRAPWGFNGGGPGSGIYRTGDGGDTWTRIHAGIPQGPLGRIGLDVYRKDPRIVFATVEHATEGGVYRSDDEGRTWHKVSATNPRPMYFSTIRVDPTDDRRIYLLAQGLLASNDGGTTFSASFAAHPDHHALWIDPADPTHLIDGNDGGVAISRNRGRTWRSLDNMDVAQVYHVGFDLEHPYRVYVGLQDNMSWGGPSATRSRLGIGNGDWFMVGEYDGFVTVADPADARTVYTEAFNGRVFRVDRTTNERSSIQPASGDGEAPLRWNWNAPLLISPHDSKTLIAGADRVLRSADRGHSWVQVSPDLTSGVDRDTLRVGGLPGSEIRLSRHDGVGAFPTLTVVAESPVVPGLYFAGADDGSLHMSADTGRSWSDLRGGLPPPVWGHHVSAVVPSRFDPDRVYLALDGHRSGDYEPHVFASGDRGRTWSDVSAALPAGHVVRTLTEDRRRAGLLYAGTEFGLFVSFDGGATWARFRAGLPTVPVRAVQQHPVANDLIVGSHGRGVWILDDATPLQLLPDVSEGEASLFPVRAAEQILPAEDRQFWGDQRFFGANPPPGALVGFYLRRAHRRVEIAIRNLQGDLVRCIGPAELGSEPKPGVHRAVWDLRHEPLAEPLLPVTPITSLFGAVGTQGPFVLPAQYQVSLIVDGGTADSTTVEVRMDPEARVEAGDIEAVYAARMALYELHASLLEVRRVVETLGGEVRRVRHMLDARAERNVEAAAGLDKIERDSQAVERTLGWTRAGRGGGLRIRVGTLEQQLHRSSSRPTLDQAAGITEAQEETRQVVLRVNQAAEDLSGWAVLHTGATPSEAVVSRIEVRDARPRDCLLP